MVLVGIGRGLSPTRSLSLSWFDRMSALTQALFQYRRYPVRRNILVQENVRFPTFLENVATHLIYYYQ